MESALCSLSTVLYKFLAQAVFGLSFLFIEMKELCEARAKLEMSSNLADEPTLADVPPFETAWQKSDSYAFPYCQWEPIRNS